jgi:hypothetical protein
MEEKRSVCRICLKTEKKRPLGRPFRRGKDNIEMKLKET